ncbi:hypothetical protein AXZ07_20175 [Pseudomonas mosselii]|nr:hypothetical protein AXZ07_20175 [Pseudomonas mosselii]
MPIRSSKNAIALIKLRMDFGGQSLVDFFQHSCHSPPIFGPYEIRVAERGLNTDDSDILIG